MKYMQFGKVVVVAVLAFAYKASAQEAKINIGNNQIAVNEAFTISITLQNEQLKTYSPFPDIPGFQKRGVSSQASTNIVNGQISFSQTLVQNYAPTKEGKFRLKPFTMEINGKKVESPGTEIKVGPARQQESQDPFDRDPFEEFFGRRGGGGGSKEYVDVKEDAFFALTTSKDRVYVGEGFTLTLAFYVAESNKAEMQFYDLQNQMQSILKKIKPANCWEENFGIEEIQPEQVTIEGKKFMEYKLYRATLYPINKEPVKFPAMPLTMIKYKVAKVQSFFGFNNKKQDFKIFNTKAKTVIVKDLPPHPLKDNVSVGDFHLEEAIQGNKKLTTGKSFNYNFKIAGEGNITAIRNPQLVENKNFDLYPPNTYQDINRSGLAVTGAKSFNYFVIPKEPGNFKMSELVQWVFFNTKTNRYDTLKPKLVLNINGESSRNIAVGSGDIDEFMGLISSHSNNFVNIKKDEYIKLIANSFLLFLFILTVVVMIKK